MSTLTANQLIALFETDEYDGYQMDWDDEHEYFYVSVDLHFTGAEGRTLEEYHNKNVREQDEKDHREFPEIRRQLAEAGIIVPERKPG